MSFTKRLSMTIGAVLLVLVILSSLIAGCAKPGPTATEPITWRFSTCQSANSWEFTVGFKNFCDAVQQRSGGRLIINPYAMGELGIDPKNYLDVVKSRGLEMVAGSSAYYAASVPVLHLVDLPGLNSGVADKVIDDKEKNVDIIWPKFAKDLEDTYNAKLLMAPPWPMCWLSTKKEIPDLLDMRGLKIRAPSVTMQQQIINLGGDSFYMPGSEIYPGLEKGVIDGVVTSLNYVVDFKFYEQLNYVYMVPLGHGFIPIVVSIDAFESLPKDIQNIVIDELERVYPEFIDWAKRTDSEGIAFVQQHGVEVVYPTQAQLNEWRERAIKPIWDESYATYTPEIKELFTKCTKAFGITYP